MLKTLFGLFLAVAALPAWAENPAPPPAAPVAPAAPATPVATEAAKIPDTSNMLFVQNLRKAGATLYYLGGALGMNGWFAIKDKEVQIFYTSADNKAIMVGALLSAEGANISQQQLALFTKDHPDILEMMKGTPMAQPAPSQEPPAASAPPSSEQEFIDLSSLAHVTFGKPTAPQVLMVMDVNCPHCHKAWKMLEKSVDEGKISVLMIPIPALGGTSAQQEAVWLASANPQDQFKKLVAGDTKALDGTPPPDKLALLAKSMEVVQRWKISQTPTLLYRGKSGKVRLIVGEPAGSDIILNDIGG